MPVRATGVLLSEPGVAVGFHSVLPRPSTGKVGAERVEQGSSASAGMKWCDESCLMTAYILFGPSQNGMVCSPAVGRTGPGNRASEVAACGCSNSQGPWALDLRPHDCQESGYFACLPSVPLFFIGSQQFGASTFAQSRTLLPLLLRLLEQFWYRGMIVRMSGEKFVRIHPPTSSLVCEKSHR